MTTTIETCTDLGDWFEGLVITAMRRRRVVAATETTRYVAGVLATCSARADAPFLDRPLVVLLDEALTTAPHARSAALQAVGDGALCLSGLFGDHVARRQVDTGLYAKVGSFAYREAAALARAPEGTEAVALAELGDHFPRFVDVVAEVAEAQCLGAVTKSIVQLYDRWKSGGSERAAEEMIRRGMFPAKGGGDS
jgi:hypothetical protein